MKNDNEGNDDRHNNYNNDDDILKEVSDESNDFLSESSSSEEEETIKHYSNIFITKNSFKDFSYNTNIIDSTDQFIKDLNNGNVICIPHRDIELNTENLIK